MFVRTITAQILCCCLLAFAAAAEDLRGVFGHWIVVSLNGQVVPPSSSPDRLWFGCDCVDFGTGLHSYVLRSDTIPKQIDVSITWCNQRIVWPGIYAVRQNQMVVCMAEVEGRANSIQSPKFGTRPTSFSQSLGARWVARREHRTPAPITRIGEPGKSHTHGAVACGNRIAYVKLDDSIVCWDFEERRALAFIIPPGEFQSLRISPDREHLAIAKRTVNGIKAPPLIWNCETMELERSMSVGHQFVEFLGNSGNVLVDSGTGATVFDARRGIVTKRLETESRLVAAVASADGRQVALQFPKHTTIWRVEQDDVTTNLRSRGTSAFSKDGGLIAVVDQSSSQRWGIKIHDARTCERVTQIALHREPSRLEFYGDSSHLMVSLDKSVHAFDARTGKKSQGFDVGNTHGFQLTPDGTRIVSANQHGAIITPVRELGLPFLQYPVPGKR